MLPGYYEDFANCPLDMRFTKTGEFLNNLRDWLVILGGLAGLICSSILLLWIMAG